ncbi:hypothetical protein [Nonomuraea sp. NPDC050310]|uniref:hypothetical protein n=1 Tax=Nonomuraea sp. NPDC050310 TaxID=3154935 RepID=UPI0034036E18
MTDILTIVRQLGTLSRDLDLAVAKLGELEEIAVDAEGDFKVAFAGVFHEASGSVEDRKQVAITQTDHLWRVWAKAAAAVRLQKEHIKALHARIDVGRTMQSTARAEIALAGVGT